MTSMVSLRVEGKETLVAARSRKFDYGGADTDGKLELSRVWR